MKTEAKVSTSKTDVETVMLKRRLEIIARIDVLRDELAIIDEALNKLNEASTNKYALLEKILLASSRPLYFREVLERMEEAGYRAGNRDRRGSVSYLLYGRQRAKFVRKTPYHGKSAFLHSNYMRGEPGGASQ